MFRAVTFTAVLALSVGATACAPLHEQHGWVAESSELDVKPGVDTKTTVLARMGTPSTSGFMEANNWYYITTLQQSFAFYKPKTQARQVTVVRFGENDTVAAVDKYGMEKGRVIAYSGDKTPTRGRELSILEQLLGNVGARPPIPGAQDTRDQNRR